MTAERQQVGVQDPKIRFQTALGPADDDIVDDWELLASCRALNNLKALLHGEPMHALLKSQLEQADSTAKEILARSNGEFRPCRVEVAVQGLSATSLFQYIVEAAAETSQGTYAERREAASKMLPTHPEHYALTPYPGIVETIGGLPMRLKVGITDKTPQFVIDAQDDSYPIRLPSSVNLDDDTIFGWLMHQFRDTTDGGAIILTVWWPAAAPGVYFDDHTRHFSVEFRNFIRLAAARAQDSANAVDSDSDVQATSYGTAKIGARIDHISTVESKPSNAHEKEPQS